MKTIAIISSGVALLLHSYICFGSLFVEPNLFLVGLFLAGCLPYAISLAVLRRWPGQSFGAALAAGLCLAIDILMFIDVTRSTSSTASFGYLIAPPFNVLIVTPFSLAAGAMLTTVLGRWRARKGAGV
jgi:hypothetical protein